ncbi:SH2 domain-containing adapter protein D isoform 2-T2 [Chlamydotis macqueenii]
MAKWLREYLGRGTRRSPPRPPQPDYSGGERRPTGSGTGTGSGAPSGAALRGPAASPRHRLVRVGGAGPGGGPRRLEQGPGESEYSEPFEGEQDPAPEGCEEPSDAAVQFESPEHSPSLTRQLPPSPRLPAGARPGCPPSPRHVDTSLPLEKQAWYHGPIGRAGAETLLALCREGSFLVRDCETSPDDYSLSLRSSHGFVHVKLTRTREQHFVLGRAGAAFPSVPEAVRHYTARALPVRGARHVSLLYPVAVQPL